MNNVANGPKYSKLNAWRSNVILDQGVSDDFRARDIFPKTPPNSTVDDWVAANDSKYDFNRYGWPAWYPTRSLADWEKARALWAPYVFRGPSDKVAKPTLVHGKKKSNPKKRK